MRKVVILVAVLLSLVGADAVAPAATATTYTCHFTSVGPYPDPLYAGYYSGDTYVPVSGAFSKAAIEAQCLVNLFGISPGTTDGVYGPNTQSAIKKFQEWANTYQHAGLSTDGFVGPATWPLLRKYSNN